MYSRVCVYIKHVRVCARHKHVGTWCEKCVCIYYVCNVMYRYVHIIMF